jgi:crotonobetaine/carnitine-CoA ligase
VSIQLDWERSPLRELEAAGSDAGSSSFITIGGETTTYAQAWQKVREVAHGMAAAGIEPGDRVVIFLPNRLEAVWSWWGVQAIGAIDAPISTAAPGAFLRHLVDDLRPKAAVGTPELLERLAATGAEVDLAIVVGGAPDERPMGEQATHLDFSDLVARGKAATTDLPLPQPDAPGTIMYSSGTTGPSKGVLLSQGYYSSLAAAHTETGDFHAGVKIYCVQPLCHVDGRSSVVDVLHLRGHVVLGTKFSASGFWREVEKHDVDVFFYVGTMIHLIHKQPPHPLANPNRRRTGMGSATPHSIHREFEDRFNVDLVEGYGMTELGLMLSQRKDRTEPGHIGWTIPWIEVQVVDQKDSPVATGVTGQLVARPCGPHLHMLGYWNRPADTVEAWRGLWFHTGDLVRRREDGAFVYIGRTKDAIRRRGENVSAWEVEQAATRHELVLEAAAIGVPSDLGEEDVALLVVPTPAGEPDPAELRAFMAKDLPRFALPRYVEIVAALPKTPSERIAKGVVRERGITDAAHDLEARS